MDLFGTNNKADYAESVTRAKEAIDRGEKPKESDMERVRKAAQYMDGEIGRTAREIVGK